jgi:HD-GYP domain-containing protein (c-di-GMP phosphodiesterase class II)
MLKKIDTRQLRIGMYVSELDRPWTETSFLFQGLLVESPEDIDQLQELCSYVYIDSEDEVVKSDFIREFGIRTDDQQREVRQGIREILSGYPLDYSYPVILPVEQEIEAASQAYHAAASVFSSIWSRVRAGKAFSCREVEPAIHRIISSVIRNPDAFLMLRTLYDDRDYNCRHAINTCALAAAFGRHLGLYPDDISTLASSAFLMDIGKARLPEELLNKRGPLAMEEQMLFRCHVELAVELLRDVDGLPPAVGDMIRSHHERVNGSGYPYGLDGNQIPVFARIAALVDSFDAITIERPYKKPLPVVDALNMILEATDVDFQKQFVEEFLRCLGPYPTGTVVDLSNDYVAVVIEQNPVDRDRPRVMLLYIREKPPEERYIVIDLGEQVAEPAKTPIVIRAILPKGIAGGTVKHRILSLAS